MKHSTPSAEEIQAAAAIIRNGGLVVMPTETVYGLAADALNPDAVQRIFDAKGRPAENPLIVHISDLGQLESLVQIKGKDSPLPAGSHPRNEGGESGGEGAGGEVPGKSDEASPKLGPEGAWGYEEILPAALRLAEAFWPGPLTLILPKSPEVPSITTGGLDTVALRMPSHPVAQALIQASGKPLAAPSANLFGETSPTRVEHLSPALLSKVGAVLDAGPCAVGIESTVLDLSTPEGPTILRPGFIGRDKLEFVLGRPVSDSDSDSHRSPGLYKRHYAPRTKLHLVESLGNRPGLTFASVVNDRQIQMPREPNEYARLIYHALFTLDQMEVEAIYAEAPPLDSAWNAVWDRLRRATG